MFFKLDILFRIRKFFSQVKLIFILEICRIRFDHDISRQLTHICWLIYCISCSNSLNIKYRIHSAVESAFFKCQRYCMTQDFVFTLYYYLPLMAYRMLKFYKNCIYIIVLNALSSLNVYCCGAQLYYINLLVNFTKLISHNSSHMNWECYYSTKQVEFNVIFGNIFLRYFLVFY